MELSHFFYKLFVPELVKKLPASVLEHVVSLPCSQKPATGPYSKTAESRSNQIYFVHAICMVPYVCPCLLQIYVYREA
jgi:hypothetical protein